MVCSFCHEDKPDTVVRIDPFAAEINDERIELPICDDCYSERCDAI
jgi:hypothetical protein